MIFKKIEDYFVDNKAFVVYRKPKTSTICGFFQEDDTLFQIDDYSQSGFVFAPFDDKQSSILIPYAKSEFISENLSLNVDLEIITKEKLISDAEKEHCDLVNKAITFINKNEFKKVVLSRKQDVKVSDFKLVETFKRLLQKYPNAFVYVWFHPKIGLWLGATPETLLKINGTSFETMSLAGTRVYKGNQTEPFEDKEYEEQQIVTDYIIDTLSKCSEVKKGKVESVFAGNLIHLKTKITGVLNSSISELITELHPTPAVCGMPKEEAKQFILKNEPYNREFYTGFLGELNFSEQKSTQNSSLFVNLRCMKIYDNQASIYVGGGITKDSNPLKEFQETLDKSMIMYSVL